MLELYAYCHLIKQVCKLANFPLPFPLQQAFLDLKQDNFTLPLIPPQGGCSKYGTDFTVVTKTKTHISIKYRSYVDDTELE